MSMGWTDTGFYDQSELGKLPPKESGKHRWMAAASYSMTEEEAAAGMSGTTNVYLDHESRFILTVGCWDCEQTYPLCYEQPCPAPGDDQPYEPPPRVSDPIEANVPEEPHVGEGKPDLGKAILVDGVGAAPVITGRNDDNSLEMRLALSFSGRQNRSGLETHHFFLLDHEMVGFTLAQILFYSMPMGDEVQERFNFRMEELQKKIDESGD